MNDYPDESPYPRSLVPSLEPDGLILHKQDEYKSPGGFALIRKLHAHSRGREFYIGTELWRHPPREYPPAHTGDSGIGFTLDLDEAAALWHSLGEWIVAEATRRVDPPGDMI